VSHRPLRPAIWQISPISGTLPGCCRIFDISPRRDVTILLAGVAVILQNTASASRTMQSRLKSSCRKARCSVANDRADRDRSDDCKRARFTQRSQSESDVGQSGVGQARVLAIEAAERPTVVRATAPNFPGQRAYRRGLRLGAGQGCKRGQDRRP
jgi:hypothetical protein